MHNVGSGGHKVEAGRLQANGNKINIFIALSFVKLLGRKMNLYSTLRLALQGLWSQELLCVKIDCHNLESA